MKRIIAIMLMSLFGAGCSLGVPIVDDGIERGRVDTGGDNQVDRTPPDRDPPGQEGPTRGVE